MKKKKDLFRGNSEARFKACVALIFLGASDKVIRQWVSIDAHQLKRWRSAEYEERFEAELERNRALYASPTARAERFQQLQVDCAVRHLLEKRSVRFMRQLSMFLDAAVAHRNGERINWETLKNMGLPIDVDPLEAAITAAANKVNLDTVLPIDADGLLNALIARLQAAAGKERDDGHP